MSSGIITCTLESAQNHPDISFDSIRLTTDYVFASTQNGIYRATLNERNWSYLHCPDTLPVKGTFANHIRSLDPILFITDQGLFSSSDNGSTWHLISNAYQFHRTFVHPDGTLYANAWITIPCSETIRSVKDALDFLRGKSWSRTCIRNTIMMSSDFGQSWHDITGIAEGLSIYGIFQDPDHPDLVILFGENRRGYVLQATDKSYNWQEYQAWDWEKNHTFPRKSFFTKDYSPQTTFYNLRPTLTNYFDYNFGEQVHLPGFDIVTDQTAYTFVSTDNKIIKATIKFLPTTGSDKLIDLKDSTDLWGVRILDSAGRRINQLPKLTQLKAASSDRQRLIQQYRDRPDFSRISIDHAQAYTKSIDLNDLFNLLTPGVYQVQFIYDNASIAESDKGEWVGSFAGNVFTVTVTTP